MNPFVERHQDDVRSTLSCFDRVATTGTLPEICRAEGMDGHLGFRDIRLFDYARWAEPLREELREKPIISPARRDCRSSLSAITMPSAKRRGSRRSSAERGEHSGLVHIFSAMELASSYRP